MPRTSRGKKKTQETESKVNKNHEKKKTQKKKNFSGLPHLCGNHSIDIPWMFLQMLIPQG